MSGPGILAIFNNVAPGRDEDFNSWFQAEHMEERLGVPGFLYGRRHQALSGSSEYFNFYVTESPDVLTSKAYLDRVNNPTPRSRVTMAEIFRDMCRTVCRREMRVGSWRGGMTITARFEKPHDMAELKGMLEELAADETVSGEIWVSAEISRNASEEERLRGGDRKVAQCLLIDTLDQKKAEQIAGQLRRRFPAAEVGVFRVIAHMGDSSA